MSRKQGELILIVNCITLGAVLLVGLWCMSVEYRIQRAATALEQAAQQARQNLEDFQKGLEK